jgi:UDP-N-acetyl-D-mannosaminuronic acid dehydrogenase
MNSYIKNLVTFSTQKESIDSVVRRMSEESRKVVYPGIVVILDGKGALLGIVTDGDIRRAYSNNIVFSKSISEIMIDNPITVSNKIPEKDISLEVIRKIQFSSENHSAWVKHVLIVDSDNILVDIVDYSDTLQKQISQNKVVVFGMGYVGITLAVSLANRGHKVLGIDTNKSIVNSLNTGDSHVLEPGLSDILAANLKRNSINFNNKIDSNLYNIYIVAVGTPLDSSLMPDMSDLISVLEDISIVLKQGDQVILRSTVPVGVTRKVVIPYLESATKLKVGKDFYVSFAPERTIEGDAMNELKTLPQVIGGYSSKCLKNSYEFWTTLTPTVVRVDTLEAAELVKLANNSFRDLSFSFSNEMALLADRFNVNTFDLINAANEGYPRNKIPLPSPGVGGYCLTKDPILFSCTYDGLRSDAVLGLASRKINERAALYPIDVVKKYANMHKLSLSKLNILIIGIAFKGAPETTDVRGSVAIDLLHELNKYVDNIFAWDAVIKTADLEKIGFDTIGSLSNSIRHVDVVLILNNHPNNIHSGLYTTPINNRLIFDGWNQVDRQEIEKISGMSYATMGYMTPMTNP